MDIVLQPVGEIDTGLMGNIRLGISSTIGHTVSINTSVPIPQQAYNAARGQYLAEAVIEEIFPLKPRGAYLLGVTGVNLFTHEKNFVFGAASPILQTAVISIHLLNEHTNEKRETMLLERAVKEAMHELGHLMGMEHCTDVKCVMHFSSSLVDTDVKNAFLCPKCRPKLL